MNTKMTLLVLAMAATNVFGCSISCNPECRYGQRLTEKKTVTVECSKEGVQFSSPFSGFSSCEQVRVTNTDGCTVERIGLGEAKAVCEGKGSCNVEWGLFFDTCVCDAEGPCDGKCTALPSCPAGLELSKDDCAIVEGKKCEVVPSVCCKTAHCVGKANTAPLRKGDVCRNRFTGLDRSKDCPEGTTCKHFFIRSFCL